MKPSLLFESADLHGLHKRLATVTDTTSSINTQTFPTLISSAFTALLNCAEVGLRNRILTNYRFLSHSLLFFSVVVVQVLYAHSD